jgi:hypothetical protein
MLTSALPPVSSLEGCVYDKGDIPSLLTMGEYTMYPMEFCTEDQVAKLFSKICQRGNPVLQGRPAADLILLGRAMYRKAKVLSLGQVAVHKGQPVALGFSWDVADGGVWKDSGLECLLPWLRTRPAERQRSSLSKCEVRLILLVSLVSFHLTMACFSATSHVQAL